jgi:hypothetical protein
MKVANSVIGKLSCAISSSEALSTQPNFYLLHAETTKAFSNALTAARELFDGVQAVVASGGKQPLPDDAPLASQFASSLKKNTAVLTTMLKAVARTAK